MNDTDAGTIIACLVLGVFHFVMGPWEQNFPLHVGLLLLAIAVVKELIRGRLE